jgi:predicted DCC family thiol-disulfide oxidoreductase YuxK
VTDDAHAGERPSGLPSERRWAVLYDADCGFCKWLLSALLRWDRATRLHPIALQQSEADNLVRELTPAERMASWHLISPSGERRSGGAAVAPLLRVLPAGRLPAAGFARFPRLTDRGYRWVAEHRSQLSKWVPSRAKLRASQRVHQREQDRETQMTSHRSPTTADQAPVSEGLDDLARRG